MVLNELLILSVPAAAAAFKLGALVLAVVWAARAARPPATPLGARLRARVPLTPRPLSQRG
jgi:hypothetical protein